MTGNRRALFVEALVAAATFSVVFLVAAGDVRAYTGIDGGYVGSDVCGTCHTSIKSDFDKSGHPYKFRTTAGATPTLVTDPISSVLIDHTPLMSTLNPNGGTAIDDGPGHLDWSAVDYIIGGFGWKARFGILDTINPPASTLSGFVWSSTASGASGAQYNMLAWGPYDPLAKRADWSSYGNAGGQTKGYECAKCHNTNGTVFPATYVGGCGEDAGTRTQPWANNPALSPAIHGGFGSEWTFDSVQCEACHGPGETHANAPTAFNISNNDGLEQCGKCHTRAKDDKECYGLGAIGAMSGGAADGFIKHHEQYNEMVGYETAGAGRGVHADLTCVTCHDPHKRAHKVADEVATVLDITDNNLSAAARDAVTDCASCHAAQASATGGTNSSAAVAAHNAAGVSCVDCHMAEATKSATGIKGTWGKKGDVKTHIFKVSPGAADATVGARTNGAPTNKPIAENYLSLDYACGKCHDTGVSEGGYGYAAGATLPGGITDKATASVVATGYHAVTGIDGGYVGSDSCAGCHASQHETFTKSGHPYKFRATNGATPTLLTDPVSSTVVGHTPLISTLNPINASTPLGGLAVDDGTGHLDWSSVDYVIGGFGWKARWGIKDTVNVDGSGNPVAGTLTGFVWASGASGASGAQYNILAQDDLDPAHKRPDWSSYGNAGAQSKAYECAKCHNTNGTVIGAGYAGGCGEDYKGLAQPWGSNPGLSDSLRGGFGSEWTFDGVQCEACHGPAKDHVANPTNAAKYPVKDLSLEDCGKCHTRAADDKECYGLGPIGALSGGASDGFIKHHEQYNEMVGACVDKSAPANGNCTDPADINLPGVHASLKCQDCHDPHKRSHKLAAGVATALGVSDNDLSGEDRSAVVPCESCHAGKTLVQPMGDITCIDCHMAEATKSATGEKGTWGKKGDVKTHIFKISAAEPNGATVGALTNSKGKTITTNYLSVDYACGKCHDASMSSYIGNGALTKIQAQTYAAGIHGGKPTASFGYALAYPNTLMVNVNAAASTCSSGPCSYDWNWGDGTAPHGTGVSNSHTYATAGVKTITLTVKDTVALTSDTKSVNVTVSTPDLSPAVDGVCAFDPNTWIETLTDTSTDDGTLKQVTVNWGDGSMLSNDTSAPFGPFTHTYPRAGSFTLTHKAVDTTGQQSTRTCTATPAYFSISGTVKNKLGTANLPSATVVVKKSATGAVVKTVYTAANGTFSAGSLKPGSYTLTVTKNGYTFAVPAATITVGPSSAGNTINATAP